MQINVPTGGSFDINELIKYINLSDRNYIIQGQRKCLLKDHPKPQSLDCWLRKNVLPQKIDTKRADNAVLLDLIATGIFEEQRGLVCPTSSRKCKGLVLVAHA